VIRGAFNDFGRLQEALERRGITPLSAEHRVHLLRADRTPEDQAAEVLSLIDKLEQTTTCRRFSTPWRDSAVLRAYRSSCHPSTRLLNSLI